VKRGVPLGLWYYTGDVYPTIPSYITWDFSALPIFAAMLIQVKPHINPFLKSVFYGGVCTFVGEPIFLLLDYYVIVKWNLIYSFFIYMIIYLLAHRISKSKSFAPLSAE